MSAIAAALTVQPSVRFRHRKWFYVLYDGTYLLLTSLALTAMIMTGWQGLVREWHWWYLLLLPLVCHVHILASVFIHNCSHGNFPKAINRLVGELCGIVVLTRYASWEIIHRRHHKYSDDLEMDPHPISPEASGYFPFVWRTIINVETQLQRQFYELHGGDTPENRKFEKRRAYTSYATNLVLVACWYMLLGPIGFFFFFLPASLVGFFHINHFNWSTHNAHTRHSDNPEFYPVNLDDGFFWVGNRIWFGIYYHAYHHKQANLFNPRFYEAHQQARADRIAAKRAGDDDDQPAAGT